MKTPEDISNFVDACKCGSESPHPLNILTYLTAGVKLFGTWWIRTTEAQELIYHLVHEDVEI